MNDMFQQRLDQQPFARRQWLAGALVAGAIGWTKSLHADDTPEKSKPAATPAADAEFLAGTSWPLVRGDVLATGVARTTLPNKPEVVWTFKPKKASFGQTAAIANGLVFIGDIEEKLFALRLTTGEPVWEVPCKLGFVAPPAFRQGKVYVGDGEGKILCLDAAKGKPIWNHPTDGEIISGANFVGDKVLIGSQDATLYCLDAEKGTLVWNLKIDNQIRTQVTVAENRAFLMQCDGKLHVVDLDKGTAVSSIPLKHPTTSSTPAVMGDRLFMGSENGEVLCLDWKKGTQEWVADKDKLAQAYHSSPALTKDVLVIGNQAKFVKALRPADGTELWTFETKSKVEGSPVIVGDRCYVGAGDGRVYGINLADGQEVWQYQANGPISGSPAIAAGKMVIATERGVVYCFGEKTK